MTEVPDAPDPVERPDPTVPGESAGSPPDPEVPAESAEPTPTRRRRVRRRAERAGTNPSADDAPDVVAPRAEPAPGETQHDRWLREQRPPHWE